MLWGKKGIQDESQQKIRETPEGEVRVCVGGGLIWVGTPVGLAFVKPIQEQCYDP